MQSKMQSNWYVALVMVLIISVVYLTIDYYYRRYTQKKFYELETLISEADTVDELLELRKRAWGNEVLIKRIDMKLNKCQEGR